MVNFSPGHKHELKAGSTVGSRYVDWFDEDGNPAEMDISKMDTDDLWQLKRHIESYYQEQVKAIEDELDNWTEVFCAVCGMSQIAYRGYPFVTWGFRSGWVLCPQHLRAYDLLGTPDGERLKMEREEEEKIQELFG